MFESRPLSSPGLRDSHRAASCNRSSSGGMRFTGGSIGCARSVSAIGSSAPPRTDIALDRPGEMSIPLYVGDEPPPRAVARIRFSRDHTSRPLRVFGVYGSLAIAFSTLMTFTLLPALLTKRRLARAEPVGILTLLCLDAPAASPLALAIFGVAVAASRVIVTQRQDRKNRLVQRSSCGEVEMLRLLRCARKIDDYIPLILL